MSKTRVYEIAKELGLENKAIFDLCEKLAIDGKSSHSNSLSDDEAEKIRRYVIRRAVSDKDNDVKELRREGHVVTERRVGRSVIRRRKKAEEVESEEQSDAQPKIDLEQDMPSASIPDLVPDLARDKQERSDALDAANALFKSKEPLEGDVESENQVQESVEQGEPAALEELPSEDLEVSSEESQAESEVGDPQEAESGDAEQSLEAELEPVEPEDEEDLEDVRRRHDIRAPKVLGKIELPVAPPKPEPVSSAKPERGVEESDSGSSRHSKGKKRKSESVIRDDDYASKKKRRKKQVLSKKELVDYDGDREGWRTKRDKRGKKFKSDQGDGARASEAAPMKASKMVVKVDGQISVGELAKQLGAKAGEVMGKLMGLGVMATINQFVDLDTATLVAEEYGFTVQNVEQDVEVLVGELTQEDNPEDLVLRPPVVTVMGHVDHGKTSLLDAIREKDVTASEFGGITQHIGAYNVSLPSGGSVTFLDTPGHEAFTAMRSRGAQVTDIVVLVVAADDGVMPQTIEAINHAKAAEVPIIVAVNKMDLENAAPDKVIGQLAEYDLVPEDWGGDTLIVKLSAHTKDGIDDLLENLHLQAEVLELTANPGRRAVGTVIESRIDKGRGPIISVLVQKGTLKKGDVFVAGAVSGRVRALNDDDGVPAEEAGPSIPVEILGVSKPAVAGDDFIVLESESQARQIADDREQHQRRKRLASQAAANVSGSGPLTLERFSTMMTESVELKELPLIVKADVQGSVEAVADALGELSNEEVKVKVLHKAVGAISENDVQLASASRAIIVAFNVRPDPRASAVIEDEGIDVLYSRVIYDLVDSVNSALKGRMAPKFTERTLGHVQVRQTFKVPKLGTIAGCYVTDGSIERNSNVRLTRDGVVVFEGKMASLRRFKDDVKEVAAGYECGIGLEGFADIKEGDIIEVYKVEEVKQQ